MEIKLDKFSGPLDLLLRLIEERQLEITEISLAEVTDQYLAYLESRDIGIAELADFLVVASKLLVIKSRALLPSLEISSEEEEDIRDLTLQLQEYQRYRNAALFIRQSAASAYYMYARSPWHGFNLGFFPPRRLEAEDLAAALSGVVEALRQFVQPLEERVIARTVSIEEKIKEVTERIRMKAMIYIKELATSGKKPDLILAFLAILFLFNEKVVKIVQSKRFGEISVVKQAEATSDN